MTDVRGRCPACNWHTLFLGNGGHVTCSRLECPNPSAADELLHGKHVNAAAELARFHEGEEPVTDPAAEHTPGQWIWRWNRATPAERLEVAARAMGHAARAGVCFEMAHEKRLEEDRKAWVIVARVRDVVGEMERITGARHWARILQTALSGEQPAVPDSTDTTEPAHNGGPSVEECREADRRWPLQKTGE